MGMWKEWQGFALKGNVLDLAVAVVIGAAFTKIVNALVEQIIMPLINAITPGGDWRTLTVTPLKLGLGPFLGAVLDFLLVSFVIFIVVVKLREAVMKKPEAKPSTKTCPECLETIPIDARRCKFCTVVLARAS
ncbi:MAG TPA: large conductance mechanosensitive channel protein MscL [Myxococcaceae bacterium]|jgi:large conductance mechanosensitive channel|nr:large conductance mechanosensitive channel protein MscL [Myxococcaceae bacterium]